MNKVPAYLKELLAKRQELAKQYDGPISSNVIGSNQQMQIEKIRLDTEISLLQDLITAIEKLVD